MERKVGDFLPLRVLFAPYQNLAVVGGRGKDIAVFRVSLIIQQKI